MNCKELSSELSRCTSVLRGRVVYMDYPVHGNVGDLLIWFGARRLLEREKVNVTAQFGAYVGMRARAHLERSDSICFHGGGNFGDLYPAHQNLRESLIKQYPNKRIVIFPQSIHFSTRQKLSESCRILKGHPDLHIFVRDRKSYGMLENEGVDNIYLAPDTAHALWPVAPTRKPETGWTLNQIRRDPESLGVLNASSDPKATTFDWEDLRGGMERYYFRAAERLSELDGKALGNTLPMMTIWDWEARRLLQKAIDVFSRHERVVTDRLHAMILCTLMNKKCLATDNTYGKLSSYHALWLKNLPNISFAAGTQA